MRSSIRPSLTSSTAARLPLTRLWQLPSPPGLVDKRGRLPLLPSRRPLLLNPSRRLPRLVLTNEEMATTAGTFGAQSQEQEAAPDQKVARWKQHLREQRPDLYPTTPQVVEGQTPVENAAQVATEEPVNLEINQEPAPAPESRTWTPPGKPAETHLKIAQRIITMVNVNGHMVPFYVCDWDGR